MRVLSFEPSMAAHAKARARSSSYPNWEVCDRVAVGARADALELNVAANSVSSSLLPMEHLHIQAAPDANYVGTERVWCACLDDLVRTKVDKDDRIYLKVDTQGYELPVLEGAPRTLDQVVALQTEVSFAELYKGQALAAEVVNFLERRGFALFGFSNGIRHPVTCKLLQADTYFIKEACA
jgi:FkbM family methyltransferase